MKVLVVADKPSSYFYDHYSPGKLRDFDLIIACGDLDKRYLEFLVSLANCPLWYVCGNHDEEFVSDPPEGCVCIDGKVMTYRGIRFLGLGGSYRYHPSSQCMYTEEEMKSRIRHLWFSIWKARGFDVLVTHAPAKGLGDLEDLPHRGFACFTRLLDKYRPRFFLHGHVHRNYGRKIPVKTQYGKTLIVNAFEYQILDI